MNRAAVAAVLMAGALGLTGCAGASPQVAAYVGSDQIPLAQVEAVSVELTNQSPDETDQASSYRATVLAVMIESKIAQQVATAQSIQLSDELRQSFYSTNQAYQVLAKNPVTGDFMKGFADLAIVVGTENGKAALQQALATTPIRLNPRFGSWDPRNLAVTGDGSLSVAFSAATEAGGVTAATPAPSPSASR